MIFRAEAPGWEKLLFAATGAPPFDSKPSLAL
jgi:hypothetical protein